jgi:shikimate kinase
MGCGKSTVGKVLAQALNVPFVDLDEEITQMAKATIPEIFATLGEVGFRDYEYNALRLLPPKCVVATGGGAFAWPKTHNRLQEETITVWLKVPTPVLWARLGKERAHRPLLQSPTWQQDAETLYAQRQSWYEKAQVTIPADGDDVFTLVQKILTCPALSPQP